MATKIYEDATTKELVIIRGTLESRYAAFSDLSRTNDDNSKLSVTHSNTGMSVLDPTYLVTYKTKVELLMQVSLH